MIRRLLAAAIVVLAVAASQLAPSAALQHHADISHGPLGSAVSLDGVY